MSRLLSTLVLSALAFSNAMAEQPVVVFATLGSSTTKSVAVNGKRSMILASDGSIKLTDINGVAYTTNASSLRSISFEMGEEDQTSKVNQVLTENSDLGVYPNPAVDDIVVSGLVPGDHVTIYSTSGRKAAEFKATSDAQEVNVSALPAGIYMITNETTTIKFEKK